MLEVADTYHVNIDTVCFEDHLKSVAAFRAAVMLEFN